MPEADNLHAMQTELIRKLAKVQFEIAKNSDVVFDGHMSLEGAVEKGVEYITEELQLELDELLETL